MNLMKLISEDQIALTFIFGNIEDVEIEMGNRISGLLNKKWTNRRLKMSENFALETFLSTSYLEKVCCLLWNPLNVDLQIVAFITNMPDGWPTLLNSYSFDSGRKIIRVRLSDNSTKNPVNEFSVVIGSERRTVQVLKDYNRWEFFETGTKLSFEDESYYRRRSIADRLNPEIIQRYLIENSIDITADNFFHSGSEAIEFSSLLNS